MNLPNQITIGRLAAVPFFAAALLLYGRTGNPVYYGAALVIFVLAVISDGLDGYLARSRNQQTRLGTFLDPLADKFLLDCALVILALGMGNLYRIPAWFAGVVIARDLVLLALAIRFHSRWDRGEVRIRPSIWGKTSAVLVMAIVIWVLIHPSGPPLMITRFALYLTAGLTVVSGVLYFLDVRRAEASR
ncbi:MAG: CDP-diacylglycerol--glycerol-3-phosphate 3-phosphatidyltransferase [Candidatus Erginobacter occultus]|nr:CDP-diacylglycerol--glycerol-3-phosphate 3-phosphatidyltransferase [Candidatus Erginobacter occultus]